MLEVHQSPKRDEMEDGQEDKTRGCVLVPKDSKWGVIKKDMDGSFQINPKKHAGRCDMDTSFEKIIRR